VLRDPQAILTYLALRYDAARRWPAGKKRRAPGRWRWWLAFLPRPSSPASRSWRIVPDHQREAVDRAPICPARRARGAGPFWRTILRNEEILRRRVDRRRLTRPSRISRCFPPGRACPRTATITLERYPRRSWRWIDRRQAPSTASSFMPGITPRLFRHGVNRFGEAVRLRQPRPRSRRGRKTARDFLA